jgi:crotonobetainyl-CoA:carnitine CoA-transferase CaiB-like acyl-CoA transferase
MTRPFEGIRIIDITHVLAGPFAAYQLAVLGADVIKVEHPDEPDQSRESGTDRALNRRNLGTSFLTQGSNKRSITLDLKTEAGRDILKKLVARADVLVETTGRARSKRWGSATRHCRRSTRASFTARSRRSAKTG